MERKFDCDMVLNLMREDRKKKQKLNEETKEISLRLVELNYYSQPNTIPEEVLAIIFAYVTDGTLFLQKNLNLVCKQWYLFCHSRVPKVRIGSKFLVVHEPELLMQKLKDSLLHPQNVNSIRELTWIEDTPQIREMDFRNADLITCSYHHISKLQLKGMHWVTTNVLEDALHNLSGTLQHLELDNCARLELDEERLQSMFFSGVMFPHLKNMTIETTFNPLILHQFLDFWTRSTNEVFPVLETLSLKNIKQRNDFDLRINEFILVDLSQYDPVLKEENYVFDTTIQRTIIKSLTQIVGSSEESSHALEFFLPLLVNCNTIGILSSLNWEKKLPDRICHLFTSSFYGQGFANLAHINTITICDEFSQHFLKYQHLRASFPNLKIVQINNISYPVQLLSRVNNTQYRGLAINAENFAVMLFICNLITQFQDNVTWNNNSDRKIRFSVDEKNSQFAFVEASSNSFFLHNSCTAEHVKQVSLEFDYSDRDEEEKRNFPVLLFQRELQRWFTKMVCLSYKLHYNQNKSPNQILKELKCNCGQKFSGKLPQDLNNSISIPKPSELMNLFSILFTSA